jgi:hypothetical protein
MFGPPGTRHPAPGHEGTQPGEALLPLATDTKGIPETHSVIGLLALSLQN